MAGFNPITEERLIYASIEHDRREPGLGPEAQGGISSKTRERSFGETFEMQRIHSPGRRSHQRHQPTPAGRSGSAGSPLRDPGAASLSTLAPAFVQALPSLEGQKQEYSHEINGELLYKLCAALVEVGLGTPEMWTQCGGDALKFAQHAIMHRIGPETGDLLQRNIEYHLEISDIDEHQNRLQHGRLVVSISCGGCGYLKIGNALAALESKAGGLGAAFYWTLVRSLYRVMRIYDLSDAQAYEENLIEWAESEDEGNRQQYEFPGVEKAIPDCIRESLESRSDSCRVKYRRLLSRHREGKYGSWIQRLRTVERLSRCRVKTQERSEYSNYYDGPPLPSLLLVFNDHDAICNCFDEESQHMLEVSSEPALCAVFSPSKTKEFTEATRSIERFVRFNQELCLLIEEIQGWESTNEGRDIHRGGTSLRAA
jgi:hypothetical protein